MNRRTPFSRVAFLGSARKGTGHFWVQRLTALAMVVLVPFLVWTGTVLIGADATTIRAQFANPVVLAAMLASILTVCWHMKLGLQVVIEDYIRGIALKTSFLIANIFFAAGMAALLIVYTVQLSLWS